MLRNLPLPRFQFSNTNKVLDRLALLMLSLSTRLPVLELLVLLLVDLYVYERKHKLRDQGRDDDEVGPK